MSSTGIGVGASMIFGGVKASPLFEYSGSAFCADASDPTPTINGTPGGTFTAAPVAPNTGTLVINSSTGTVDLSASDVGNYLVTYTVAGKSESDPFEVLAIQSTAFSYTESSFQQTGTASPTITGTSGGVFTATTGLVIDANTGVIDLAASTIGGPYTITYTNTGACQGTPSTFDVSITAAYVSTSSFSFDGVNDYITSNTNALSGLNNASISVWVKPTGATSNQYKSIVNQWEIANSAWGLWLNGTGSTYRIHWNQAGASGVDSDLIIPINEWSHIAIVKNATTLKMFYNGSEVNSFSNSAATGSGATILNIGAQYTSNSASTYFNGLIDEVSLWNTALSSDAVTEIFNEQPSGSGKPNDLENLTNASSSNLKAWYKM